MGYNNANPAAGDGGARETRSPDGLIHSSKYTIAIGRTRGRPTYLVRLRPEPRVDPVRALRAGLKSLLRRYGLRCLAVREERKKVVEGGAS